MSPDQLIAAAHSKDGNYNTGDLVRCEVVDVNADSEKLACGMKGIIHQDKTVVLGLITKEQLPDTYRCVLLAFYLSWDWNLYTLWYPKTANVKEKERLKDEKFLRAHLNLCLNRLMMESVDKGYDECLLASRNFANPSAIEYMARSLGIDAAVQSSLLRGLK